jgi:hypothetical protein
MSGSTSLVNVVCSARDSSVSTLCMPDMVNVVGGCGERGAFVVLHD